MQATVRRVFNNYRLILSRVAVTVATPANAPTERHMHATLTYNPRDVLEVRAAITHLEAVAGRLMSTSTNEAEVPAVKEEPKAEVPAVKEEPKAEAPATTRTRRQKPEPAKEEPKPETPAVAAAAEPEPAAAAAAAEPEPAAAAAEPEQPAEPDLDNLDRKSTRLNSSHI